MILMQMKPVHEPVLPHEVVRGLDIKSDGRYIDCTLGLGGHALLVLEHISQSGKLLGIDVDQQAIDIARHRLAYYSDQVMLIKDNFVNLKSICEANNFLSVNGILFDLGISSLQLDTAERGFSFQREAELDMRFSTDQVLTATDLINILPEDKLSQLLWDYGQETKSRQIARLIVKNRPIVNTKDLTGIVEKCYGSKRGKIHPATKTFLALRLVVNHELENLEKALNQSIKCLVSGGRLVIMSYHSLEDRIIKKFFKRESSQCICTPDIPVCNCGHIQTIRIISSKVIRPTAEEIRNNPRSRSAKLRVAEKL